MPDFGIGEGLLAASLFGGAEAATGLGASALGAELGAGALGGAAAGGAAGGLGLGAEALGAGALGAGALGGAEIGGLGGATSATGTGLATDALATGFGLGESLGGGSSIESLLANPANANALDAFAAGPGGAVGAPSATAIAGGGVDTTALGAVGGGEGGLGGLGGGSASNASLFSKLGSAITGNPLQAAGIGVGAAGLGYNLYKGSQDSAERKALSAGQQQLGALGPQLMSYLQSGRLPPGMQERVDRDNAAAKARIIQGYATRGQPTDPTMNSALAQELSAVDTNSSIQIADIATKLLSTGIQATGMSNETLAKLLSIDRQRSADTGSAISNFAAALAGRPPQGTARATA